MTTLDKVLIGIIALSFVSVGITYAKSKLAERKAKQEKSNKEVELKAKVQPKRIVKKKANKKNK